MKKIKNIIFDLGGVIINLNMMKTIELYESFGIKDFSKTYNQLAQTPLFDMFDKGLITGDDFFETIKEDFKLKQSVFELEKAWNAMLLDFPKARLEQLIAYKNNYRTFLLSNTNTTHVKAFENILFQSHGYKNLDSFFEKAYYSCDTKMRKPDAEIFEFVLQENNLIASETLFIDDTINHVKGAEKVGINALLLPKGTEFDVLLKNYLN